MIKKRVLHLLSGGMDSTVMLYDLLSQHCLVHAVMFNYGQRHVQELEWAKYHCHLTKTLFTTVTLPQLRGSELTDGSGGVVVPFRNMVMLSTAVNLATSARMDCVTIGCNRDDSSVFSDCRAEFIHSVNRAVSASELSVEVCAPYIKKAKWEIAAIARDMGVQLSQTWSCYAGGVEPCGVCKACVLRAESLSK